MSVLYGSNSGPSGRALAAGLNVRGVRFGDRNFMEAGVHHVNWTGRPMSSVMLNANTETNKLDQLYRWYNASICCVPFSEEHVEGWLPRTNYHWGGRDFTRRIRADFWTKPIPGVKEWRLHVFRNPGARRGFPGGYTVRRVGWKVNVEPDLNVTTNGVEIRNRRTGWRLNHYAEPRPVAARDTLAKWAIAVLGWDFGCVDILQTDDEGFEKWIILEANSCPGLKDAATLRCYVQHVGALLNT